MKLNKPPSYGSRSIVSLERLAKSVPGGESSNMVGVVVDVIRMIGDSSFESVRYMVTLVLAVFGSGNPPSYAST